MLSWTVKGLLAVAAWRPSLDLPITFGNERISSGNSSSVAVSFFCVTVLYILHLPSKPDLTTDVPSSLGDSLSLISIGEGSSCKDVKAKAVRRGW